VCVRAHVCMFVGACVRVGVCVCMCVCSARRAFAEMKVCGCGWRRQGEYGVGYD